MVEGTQSEVPAPDGDWGWMVVTGMAFMFVVTMGTIPSFGVIFGEFLENLGEGTTSVTTIISVYMSVCNVTGLLNNRLSKSFSFRQIGAVGACLLFLGTLLSAFATNVAQLIVTYGMLQGFGLGLMIPAAFSSFNSYFDKRRTTAMAISQSINGAGTLLMPLLIQMLLDCFGVWGTQVIMASVSLHALLGMMALKPVAKFFLVTMSKNDLEAQHVPLLEENTTSKSVTVTASPDSMKANLISLSAAEVSSPAKCRGISISHNTCTLGIFHWLVEFFDLGLLRDPVYVNMTLGISFTHLADSTFFALEPLYLQRTLGFSKSAVSTVIAVSAAGDLAGRVFLALVGGVLSRRNRLVFWVGCLGSIMHIVVFINITNYVVIVTLTGILGFFRGCIYVTLALVFTERIPVERYPAAFGLHHAINGVIFLLFGPLVGLIGDLTGSYPVCFLVLACLMSVCVLLWAAEATCTRIGKHTL